LVGYWRAGGRALWWEQKPDVDARFRERFLALHERAAARELEAWLDDAEGALALVLLLDQFPRNAFRGTSRMYATDAHARNVTNRAIEAGWDLITGVELRCFFYLPFGHSEQLADQERSVALCAPLGEPHSKNSRRHRDIVLRFGRFPHRNPILGREMRPEEQAYLDGGGYRG
jgi:uncharacterized protein (DUF924 family)